MPTQIPALWVGGSPDPTIPMGSAVIRSNLTSGPHTVNGQQQVNGDSSVTGNSRVGGNASVSGSMVIGSPPPLPPLPAGSLWVGGPLSSGPHTVNGTQTINGQQTVNGGQRVNGNADITGHAGIGGNASIAGDASIAGNASVGRDLSVGGSLSSGPHTVNGAQTINGRQTVNGGQRVNGNARFTGGVVIGSPPPLPALPGQLWVNGRLITGNGLEQCRDDVPGDSVCIGRQANVSGANATVVGSAASAVSGGTSIGAGSQVTGENGTAIGFAARAGDPGTAVGAYAEATGRDASAFGYRARARGAESVAIGTGATADFARSVAIGPGARTSRENQVVIGRPGSSLTLPGVASGGSFAGSAHQSGPTQVLTTDGNGNIGTSSFNPTAIQNSINTLESSVKDLGRAVTSSGAIAAAFTAAPQVVVNDEEIMRCGAGLGGYGSSYAAAIGCAARLTRTSPVAVNAAIAFTDPVDYGYGTTPNFAGKIGVSFPIGPRDGARTTAQGNQARLQELEDQLAVLREQLARLQGENPTAALPVHQP